jgi:hypothetical protein
MPRKKKRMIKVDLTKSQYVELINICRQISASTFNKETSPIYPPQADIKIIACGSVSTGWNRVLTEWNNFVKKVNRLEPIDDTSTKIIMAKPSNVIDFEEAQEIDKKKLH